VPRNRRVRVRGFDRDGQPIDMELEAFPARVVQHENDHLNGVLFFDRMKSFETLAFLDEYSRFWAKDEDE
jgi:peptide deformylase